MIFNTPSFIKNFVAPSETGSGLHNSEMTAMVYDQMQGVERAISNVHLCTAEPVEPVQSVDIGLQPSSEIGLPPSSRAVGEQAMHDVPRDLPVETAATEVTIPLDPQALARQLVDEAFGGQGQ